MSENCTEKKKHSRRKKEKKKLVYGENCCLCRDESCPDLEKRWLPTWIQVKWI